MTTAIAPLTSRPAWQALEAHHAKIRDLHLRQLFADDPGRGERLTVEAAGLFLDYSKNRITDETLKLLFQLAEESGLRERTDGHVPGREDQRHRESGRPARGASGSEGTVDRRRRRGRGAPGPCRARQDDRVRQPGAERRLDGPHGPADQEHRQHRHRRLRPGAGDGLRGAQALQRPRPDLPVRLQRRRHRLRRGHPRPRPGRDAVHRLVEDVHDPGDDDQRPHRTRLVPRRA